MKLPPADDRTLEKVPMCVSIGSGRSRVGIVTGAVGAEPVRLALASSSTSDNRRRAELIARTQSSISSCDDALTRKVRLAVTIPKENECFFTVTGATACTDFKSSTRFSEYSYWSGSSVASCERAHSIVLVVGQFVGSQHKPLSFPSLLVS